MVKVGNSISALLGILIPLLTLAVCIAFVWLITLGSRIVKQGLRHFVDVKSRRDKSYRQSEKDS